MLVFLKSGEPGCKYLLRRLAEGDKEFGTIDDNTEEFERVFNEMLCVSGAIKVTECKGTICYVFYTQWWHANKFVPVLVIKITNVLGYLDGVSLRQCYISIIYLLIYIY